MDARKRSTLVKVRREEIDWTKGFAILCVLLIHAEPLLGTWMHGYVINRAVPVFLVLFGMTSEMWWSARADSTGSDRVREWFTSRVWRLMVPVWATVAVWWIFVFIFQPDVRVPPLIFLASFAGYAPSMGTFWFVTLILQWVVLFPAVRWCVVKFGRLPCLAASLAVTYVAHWHCLAIMGGLDTLLRHTSLDDVIYFSIFAPQVSLPVVGGIVLARTPSARTRSAGIAAAVAFLAGSWAHDQFVINREFTCSAAGAQRLLDVPLTMTLLWVFRALSAQRRGLGWLAWLGTASWGVYLAQMLLHDSLYALDVLPGLTPDDVSRWIYALFLLAGSVALVTVGSAARARAQAAT